MTIIPRGQAMGHVSFYNTENYVILIPPLPPVDELCWLSGYDIFKKRILREKRD